MRARVVLTAFVALLAAAQTAMAEKQDKIRVRVSAPVDSEGFAVSDEGIAASAEDLRLQLRKTKKFIVLLASDQSDADIEITALGRSGSSETHQAGSFSAGPGGAYGSFGPQSTHVRELYIELRAGAHSQKFVGYSKRGGSNQFIWNGTWGQAAKQLAKDIVAWTNANYAKLMELRAQKETK